MRSLVVIGFRAAARPGSTTSRAEAESIKKLVDGLPKELR